MRLIIKDRTYYNSLGQIVAKDTLLMNNIPL